MSIDADARLKSKVSVVSGKMTTVTLTYVNPPCQPHKRLRLVPGSPLKTEDHDVSICDVPAMRNSASLESLPAELLDMILNLSAEASLMQTSRGLKDRLPSYEAYTKAVALEALLPLREWKDGIRINRPQGAQIAKIQSYLDLETQGVLQRKVFSTYWFREAHVNHVRQLLLDWTIFKACAVYFEKSPSPSQMRRIKSFVENQRTPNIGTDLNLRLRCENSRLVYLTATPFEVEVSERRNSFYQAFEFRVLDFGNVVPDFLLQHPLTPAKHAMIRGICKWKDTREGNICCNVELLRTLILDCIIFDQLTTFYELLKLASSTQAALDLIHVERAAMLGRSRMLTPLLKQIWRQTKGHRLCDMQLIALIDDTKVNGYPNSNDTTRILAMEVAALWKIAEVERAGGRVARAFAEWPPRLSITMAGDNCAQSWFIPKDPRVSGSVFLMIVAG